MSRSTANRAPLVLVVDDDLRTREMYAAWLVYSGLRAAVAPDSEEAIEKAKKLRPDLEMS